MIPFPIRKVPGVGTRAMKQMTDLNIETLGDVKKFDTCLLENKFGKFGQRLSQLSRGIDLTPVSPKSIRKSISAEVTLSKDISDPIEVKTRILAQAQRVGRELRAKKQKMP